MIRLSTAAQDFPAAFSSLLQHTRGTAEQVDREVRAIIAEIRARGDAALIEYTRRFDRRSLAPDGLIVTRAEIDAAVAAIPPARNDALDLAATRIEAFHRAQLPTDLRLTDDVGLTLGMRWTPLESVGIYVPGGKAAYPSTVLMNAVPARVAGVARIAMCVPAPDGVLNPLVLAAARRAGVTEIYRVGGAQAVAALAYGTKTIASVARVVGPGNAYVAEAKRQVFGHTGIDAIAGPSEVVVLADADNDPRQVAVDLLAQAEHDEAAQAILITNDAAFADTVALAVARELPRLARVAIAEASWRGHGAIIVVRDWPEAAALVNELAPEHLQLMIAEPEPVFAAVCNAGAIFLGRFCPEALGDYVAGPNHVLPTARTARFASGLSTYDFLKRTTWVQADAAALGRIGPAAITLAEAEGLQAHASSIALRLARTEGGST